MTWTYRITDGQVFDKANTPVFIGYSGAGHTKAEGRNNASMQMVVAKGPIPVGDYLIGPPHLSPQTGPFTMNLDPMPGANTWGRSLFRIHGNNAENDASHGCVILPPDARHAIWESGDHLLHVIA